MRNPLSSDRRQFRSSVMYAYLKGLALLDLAYLILTVQLCYFVLNSHMWFDPQDSPEPKDDQLRSFICMFHLRPLSIFCTELIQFFYFPDPENFGQRPSSYGLEYYEVKILPMLLNSFAVASDFVIVFMTINRFKLVWVSLLCCSTYLAIYDLNFSYFFRTSKE